LLKKKLKVTKTSFTINLKWQITVAGQNVLHLYYYNTRHW